jgi:hypothetical protein
MKEKGFSAIDAEDLFLLIVLRLRIVTVSYKVLNEICRLGTCRKRRKNQWDM